VIKQCGSKKDEVFTGGCSAEEYNDRMMDDETFTLLRHAWGKDMFTIVFPPDPFKTKRARSQAEQELISQLEKRRPQLEAATQIFVVGRLGFDTNDASAERGKTMTRAQHVRDIIKMMFPSNTKIGYRTKLMVLNPKRRLQAGKFKRFVANSAFGFDKETTDRIRKGEVDAAADINRSVHVILYPCKMVEMEAQGG